MTALLWNVLLGFVWTLATGDLSPGNSAIGFVLAFAVLLFSRRVLAPSGYHRKPWQLARFLAFFVWEMILANLRVAHDVITPRLYARPAIIRLPLDARTDEEIALFSNLITLTPGTLPLEVSEDRQTMYIHAMFVDDPDELRREIKEGIERRLLEVMR